MDISTLENIPDYDYDYILHLTRDDNEIDETLHQNFNIPIEQILSLSIFEVYRDTDIKIESGSSAIGGDCPKTKADI